MVAVIGRPAESQLDRSPVPITIPPDLIGNIHKHLSALARLRIFVGHIKASGVLTDILEMLFNRGGYIDLLKGDAQKRAEGLGICQWVRSVVPKPGIVTAQISESGRFNNFIARTATSSAKVLSSPPETPITAVLARVCSRRFLSP